MSKTILTLAAVFLLHGVAASEDLSCLSEQERADGRFYRSLQQEAYAALDRRAEAYEQLETPEQIRAYQKKRRQFFERQLGGFPERSPLRAETVGTLSGDGYRIEKVIYESQPNHHVTANLYLPDAAQPVPGVVIASGHSRTAKTADYNQRFAISFAKHGMAALCFDPIGQGERSQILDDQGEPRFGSTTTEHSLMGVGSILVGRNTARYRVWDAMRSIDYLAGRPEVDPQRIGFTGCSGGGTLTSYVMALDDRVACAAPACYLTTFRRLIETIGPQDAEQNIFGQVGFGLDQPDYVLLRAPRPTLISSTTDDFFDIRGSWDNFRQAKRVYGKLGFPERVDLVEMGGGHGVKPQSLATITHWMQRWLLGRDEPVQATELSTRPPEQLLCTESGQVLTLPKERSVFELNAAYEAELAEQREKQGNSTPCEKLASRIAQLIAVDPQAAVETPTAENTGQLSRGGYAIDKLVLDAGTDVPLPALDFQPAAAAQRVYLYLHDDGKLGEAEAGGAVEQLVEAGHRVLTVDLRGQGETASGDSGALLGDQKTYFLSYLLGKPLVGYRVKDALAAARFLTRGQGESGPRQVHLVGAGQAGIVALHAAAMQPELFASVTLHETPRDWASVVRQSEPAGQLESTVHGALRVYDLPDLVRLIGKEKVQYATP